MNKSCILLLFVASFHVIYGSTGQGIGSSETGEEQLKSEEIAESVKQEVYLKTTGVDPPEIGGSRNYAEVGGGARPSRGSRHGSDIGGGVGLDHDRQRPASGIGGGVKPSHPKKHHHDRDSQHQPGHHQNGGAAPGIGGGAQPNSIIGQYPQPVHSHQNPDPQVSQYPQPNYRDGQSPQPRHSRALSEMNRFDSGYSKDCNSYYGRLICYRIYTNPEINVDPALTCWRISGNRKNCTEIGNINYLREEGFNVYESELPRNRNQRPKETELITHNGQSDYYDPYRNRNQPQNNQNYNGTDRYPSTRNSQRGTHQFTVSKLNLNDDSLESDEEVQLVRDKRGSRKNTFRNRNQQRKNRMRGLGQKSEAKVPPV